MKLQQGKWYVCIRNWSDDGWTKFYDGMLVQCEKDGVMIDCYGIGHWFDEAEAGITFREATDAERNIASATEVNVDEFMKDIGHFENTNTLNDIYRQGAEAMLRHIRANLSINGTDV